jgi:hypothetical protein
MLISPTRYPPAGICIYCGVTRYSAKRSKLGDEHIIPEALDGKLVLPEASCGQCEGDINWFEQFCLKQTFGPIRHLLNMKTKRPKSRSKTLPIELEIGGEWVKCDVLTEYAPVSILFPIFEPPEILSSRTPTRTNINTKHFLHRGLGGGDPTELHAMFKCTKGRTYQASLQGDRFALLLAKIAHSYAMAEHREMDRFNPVLHDTILRRSAAPPLPYLIGGKTTVPPASTLAQELGLARGDDPVLGVVWLVLIRLFGWLGSPLYQVVVSVENVPPVIARRT